MKREAEDEALRTCRNTNQSVSELSEEMNRIINNRAIQLEDVIT